MPIVIQELIASDTLSQAVDKINFNFDQLLLNGGGPVGPPGIPGPTGPVGGRGIRGATWYDGSANPNTLIIPGIEENDYFLQTNGQVWQYNGTVWIQTPVNLTGPAGAAGSSVGFDYIGGYNGVNPPTSINNENVAFVVPMPAGIGGGANQLTNQGVSTILLGAVGSTANPPAGITYSSAFQIPDTMAVQLDSSLVSVLIHQKDSSSSSIRFMGGGDNPNDKYEQSALSNLSSITLGIDDVFNINVPKPATSPASLSELIGFNLNTIRRGQQFYAGKQINFITGTDGVFSGLASEISDVTFTINTSNPSNPAKFSVATTLTSATALFELGGNIVIPSSSSRSGSALLEANQIGLVGSSNVSLRRNLSQFIGISSTGTRINDPNIITSEVTGIGSSLIANGAGIAFPTTTTKNGRALIEAGAIKLLSQNEVALNVQSGNSIKINSTLIDTAHTTRIRFQTTTTSVTSLIEMGAMQTPYPFSTTKTGDVKIEGRQIRIIGAQGADSITLSRDTTQLIRLSGAFGIELTHPAAGIKITGNTFLNTTPTSTGINSQVLVKNQINNRVEVLPGAPFMPIGAIIMWSGSPTALPTGWYLCNGQTVSNGLVTYTAPDLRGRFIAAYDGRLNPPPHSSIAYAQVGNQGGLRDAVVVSHSHYMVRTGTQTTNNTNSLYDGSGANRNEQGFSSRAFDQASDAFDYELVTAAGTPNGGRTSDAINGNGQNGTFKNIPPFYTLAYIIYFGI